jgi:ribosomal silencing factor RsfS
MPQGENKKGKDALMVSIKTKDEVTGDIVFEGTLNRSEVGFLLNYAINDLMHAGVQFHLDREAEEEEGEEEVRFEFPKGSLND